MVRYTVAVFVVLGCLWDQYVSQYTDCAGNVSDISDGFCDSATNNPACGYDGGDCCNCTCVDGAALACGSNEFDCLDPDCPDEEPSPYPNCTVKFNWLGNGYCDPETNNPECGYDGGDCCPCTCMDGRPFPCGSNGFDCGDEACANPFIRTIYPECVGNVLSIGDGSCSAENNNEACGYDGGDCCLCTCSGSACGITAFDCSDPTAAAELYDCMPPPPTSGRCPAGGESVWVVEDSAQARALAEGVNCSGGSFEVLWKGDVVVEKTIYVYDGTVLNVTGDGRIAIMNGNSTTRPLTVVNASVHVAGVNMSHGAGTVGGAIAAVRSSLTFDRTTFFRNAATGHGGAIYAADNSAVSLAGHTRFSDNTASIDGGAVFVSESSCSGDNLTFLNNSAGDDGGAVMATEHSSLSWSGTAIYHGNRAGDAGGAICLQHNSTTFWSIAATFHSNSAEYSAGALALHSGSTASWLGETTFDSNRALSYAGALSVRDDSYVSWNATTAFTSNRAGLSGGAIQVASGSNAVWHGRTTFAENAGEYGGALVVSDKSVAVPGGNSTFSANTARAEGGAVFVFDYSIAAWDGITAFSRNSAGSGGAVYAGFNSGLSFAGRTTFHGNRAVSADISGIELSGGALAVRSSTLTLDGETIFTDNQALGHGGAASTVGATVSWKGQSAFLNNSCAQLGGAVSFFASNVAVDGNNTFQGNIATSGGAVDAYKSRVTWGGVASFVNNSAFVGGAVAASNNSNVSFSGQVTIEGNRAFGNGSGSGGGVSVQTGTTVSFSGNVMFINNSAHSFGGAVNLWMNSTVYWNGDTMFFGCSAAYGGALFLQDETTVKWRGPTEFISNIAVISGGAVGSFSLDAGLNARGSILSVDGSTTFVNNTAGVTGGGFGMNGKLSVTFQSQDVLFMGNSAEVAGGAVSVSGFGDGPVFSAVRFVANFAGAGGGVYITGSGNEEISAAGSEPASATKFDGCQFVDNWVTATGGAIESVAGQDYISNTIFVRNTAGVGGALRLAGKVGLDNCSFVDNRSDEGEGPAIENVGILSVIKDTSFSGNVFNCEPGTYLDTNQSGNVFEVACKGCGALCEGCTFGESLRIPICTQTMEYSTSPGGATTLATVSVNRGFWRASSTSTDVLACYKSEACHGGVTGSLNFCRNGYEGPYCSICSDGYAAGFGFTCKACSDNAGGIVLVAVLAVLVLIGVAAVASYTISSQLESDEGGKLQRLTRFIPLQTIKTVIVALQIVTQFTAVANVTFPHVYQRFLDIVNVLNFDLGWISQLSVGCMFDVGIHGRLFIATIGPIIAVMFLGLTYVVAAKGSRGLDEALRSIRHRHVSMVLLMAFLVYSSVSSILFQMFACDDLEDGKKYLRADYRVECDSSKHKAIQIYAGFMILLYTVGVPTLYTTLLVQHRAVLKCEVGREESQSTLSFSHLWKPYKPSVFYYEVIECGRRVLLTGAVVFIYPNTSAQIAVTLMIAFVFAMVSEGLAPFSSRWDTWISRMGHIVVFVTMYIALLLKVDVSQERSSSQKVFEAVLVAAHLGMILAVVLEAGVMVCSLRNTVREGVSPRFRRTQFPFSK